MLAKGDSIRRPVDREDLADQVLARHRPPLARVARRTAVVAHHEVVALWDAPRRLRARVAAVGLDVRLLQPLAVDVDVAGPLLPAVAGQADQALHERAPGAAFHRRLRRRLEDDDVAAVGALEPVDEAVREHAVREPRLAAGRGPGAMEGRL